MKELENTATYDCLVIGGGPAGMMTAGTASLNGLKVLLLEKNEQLGKKLLITGGGRCNITNSEFDNRKLLAKFKNDGKYLFSTFAKYSVKETLEFFHKRGLETKVENELRTFPISEKAKDVYNTLLNYLKETNVKVLSNSKVIDLVLENKKIIGVKLANNKILKAKNIVVATGGISRPETGSTGDGFIWLSKIGHNVIKPTPSLVPIATKDSWSKKISGVKIDDVKISLFQNNQKQNSIRGKILFTHFGLTGPTILNMSKDIGELLKYGDVFVHLDLLPNEDLGKLNLKIQELCIKNNNKKIKNALSEIIPKALIIPITQIIKIDSETKCNSLKREDRIKLVNCIKNIPIEVDKLLDVDKAIVSNGGVSLDEVDFKTMQSKLFSNLYLVGDILNIDRPSGGYSLQLCWTTGFVAGSNIKK